MADPERPDKLLNFLMDRFHFDPEAVGEDEMVTEAIIMFRVVDMTGKGPFLPERVDFTRSEGCSFTMALGIEDQVRSKWEYIMAEINALDNAEEDDDGSEGV